VRKCLLLASLCNVLLLVFTLPASAQVVNATTAKITTRAVIGGTTFGEVLRVVGSPTVSSGTGTMNPVAFDADGDAVEDTNTTISTAGAWTFAGAGSFTSTLGVTGVLSGNTGTLLLGGPVRVSGTTGDLLLHDSNAGTDEKYWRFQADSNQFALQTLTDALGSPADVFRVFRTANDAARLDYGTNLDLIQPGINYNSNLGAMSRKFLTLHAAELWVETLVAQDVLATIGGRILVGPTSTLTVDIIGSDTTICLKHNQAHGADRLMFEADGKFEIMGLSGGPVAAACGYQYTVNRNLDGTGANTWYAGDAAFNTGGPGAGHWDIHSNRSNKGILSYSSTVMESHPVVYWRMGDLTTTDITGGGLTTTVNGTVDLNAGVGTPISDAQGGAQSVSSGYLTRADAAALDIVGGLSIEVWVYWASASLGTLIAKNNSGFGEYELLIGADGAVGFNSGNGSSNTTAITACSAGAIPVTTWTYLVVTRDSANVRCYINAGLVKTTAYSNAPTAGTGNLAIFARPNGGTNAPTGSHVDEVALYDRPLSQDEITRHFNTASGTVKATQFGPTQCANVRFDFSFNGWRERACFGNLQGYYDYATPTFGFAAGDPTGTYVSADATNGFRVMNGATLKFQADTSGNLFLTGDLAISTSGALRVNATGFDTGTGYYLDFNGGSPRFRIGTPISDPSPNYLRWTGSALEFQGNTVSLTSSGLSIAVKTNSTFSSNNGYNFLSTFAGATPSLWGYEDSTERRVRLDNATTQSGRTTGFSVSLNDEDSDSAAFSMSTGTAASAGDSAASVVAQVITLQGSISLSTSALTIAGNATPTTSFTCSAGQAVKSMNVVEGIIVSVSCGAP
jgi:hypothetical protein